MAYQPTPEVFGKMTMSISFSTSPKTMPRFSLRAYSNPILRKAMFLQRSMVDLCANKVDSRRDFYFSRCARWTTQNAAFFPQPQTCFAHRSEEHTSELQSLMRITYVVFCLKKKRQYRHLQT